MNHSPAVSRLSRLNRIKRFRVFEEKDPILYHSRRIHPPSQKIKNEHRIQFKIQHKKKKKKKEKERPGTLT
jgi:hypothetical protein